MTTKEIETTTNKDMKGNVHICLPDALSDMQLQMIITLFFVMHIWNYQPDRERDIYEPKYLIFC